jgi:hypothetical protein
MLCRNCEHWYDTRQWWGNCTKHPFLEHDKATEDTRPNEDCKGKDFIDKYIKYQKGVKSGKE